MGSPSRWHSLQLCTPKGKFSLPRPAKLTHALSVKLSKNQPSAVRRKISSGKMELRSKDVH